MGLLQDLEKLKKDLEGITAAEINAKVAEFETRIAAVEKVVGIVAPIIEAAVEAA